MNAPQCIIEEEIMPARPFGVPRPQAKGLEGSGGHYFFFNNALQGILYFISTLLYRTTGLYFLFLKNNCF